MSALPDFGLASAEIFLLIGVCVVLLADLWMRDSERDWTFILTLVVLAGAAVLTVMSFGGESQRTFSGTFVSDNVARVLKLGTYIVLAAVFVYAREDLRNRQLYKGEFFVLGLFGLLGIMVVASAGSLLTVYLGLELMSLSLYAMVAFDRESDRAAEAAMKYFVLGAIASGTLLYGISILYGVTGTFDLAGISAALSADDATHVGLLLGMAFLIVGIAFKLGAVPFHMWLPDVYHGAPTAATLYIGTVPKIAAFAIALRVLVDGLGAMHASWQDALIVLSVLSMGVGAIVAIAQTNIKRMLAYSTIGHVGFILLGFVAGGQAGYEAAMFYTLSYALMAAGGFGMVILLSSAGHDAEMLDDFRGLNKRDPWYAFLMMVLMFSMAGVPVFVGFHAKWIVLAAVIGAGLTWLAVLGVVFAVIGAFYYLRVVRLMYFEEPDGEEPPVVAGTAIQLALTANGAAVLAFGLFPAGLIAICRAAIAGL